MNVAVLVKNQEETDYVLNKIRLEKEILEDIEDDKFDPKYPVIVYRFEDKNLDFWRLKESNERFYVQTYEEFVLSKTKEPIRVGKVARTNWYKLRNYR